MIVTIRSSRSGSIRATSERGEMPSQDTLASTAHEPGEALWDRRCHISRLVASPASSQPAISPLEEEVTMIVETEQLPRDATLLEIAESQPRSTWCRHVLRERKEDGSFSYCRVGWILEHAGFPWSEFEILSARASACDARNFRLDWIFWNLGWAENDTCRVTAANDGLGPDYEPDYDGFTESLKPLRSLLARTSAERSAHDEPVSV